LDDCENIVELVFVKTDICLVLSLESGRKERRGKEEEVYEMWCGEVSQI
jgi:hypothetical protein